MIIEDDGDGDEFIVLLLLKAQGNITEMNSESSASRHRYDITMSRRTRKVQGLQEKPRSENSNGNVMSLQNLLGVKEGDDEDGISEHKSLKQLIKGDHHHENSNNHNKGLGRNSLGQHFNEEEKNLNQNQNQNLQVVRRNESVQEGLKLKKLVRRYAKVLGHLMKAKTKRDPHLPESSKNHVFKLSK